MTVFICRKLVSWIDLVESLEVVRRLGTVESPFVKDVLKDLMELHDRQNFLKSNNGVEVLEHGHAQGVGGTRLTNIEYDCVAVFIDQSAPGGQIGGR